MSRINFKGSNYDIEWGEEYGFYGDVVKVIDVRVWEGMVRFKFLTGTEAGKMNECEIEEFVEQNPEVKLDEEN